MIPRNSEQKEAAFGYVGGFLNACYLAGFARRLKMDHIENLVDQEAPESDGQEEFVQGENRHLEQSEEKKEAKASAPAPSQKKQGPAFYLQQTNMVNVAIPIHVPKQNVSLPSDTQETKVIGRLIGRRLPSGELTVDLRALQIGHPSIRDMPNSAAWYKPDPKGGGAAKDAFKPFFNVDDKADFKKSVFAKVDNKGRSCLNVAHIAGFIQGFTWAIGKDGKPKKDCILLQIRQTADPAESIPVRVYGSRVETTYKKLRIGLPVLVEGEVRTKVTRTGKFREDGVEIIKSIVYLHASELKLGTRQVIKVIPPWYDEMRERMLAQQAEQTAAMARKMEELNSTAASTQQSDEDVEF